MCTVQDATYDKFNSFEQFFLNKFTHLQIFRILLGLLLFDTPIDVNRLKIRKYLINFVQSIVIYRNLKNKVNYKWITNNKVPKFAQMHLYALYKLSQFITQKTFII